MKITVEKKETKEIEFPCLMEHRLHGGLFHVTKNDEEFYSYCLVMDNDNSAYHYVGAFSIMQGIDMLLSDYTPITKPLTVTFYP